MFEKLMPKHREIWEHDSLASFVPIGRESNTSRCCTTVALGSRDWDLRVILDQASKIVLVGICHSHLARLVPPRPNCQLPNILGSPWVPSIVVRGLHYRCTSVSISLSADTPVSWGSGTACHAYTFYGKTSTEFPRRFDFKTPPFHSIYKCSKEVSLLTFTFIHSTGTPNEFRRFPKLRLLPQIVRITLKLNSGYGTCTVVIK